MHKITAQMTTIQHIAKHLRDVYFSGNWTSANLKEQLADVTWQEATTKVYECNTIATLAYHIHYYVATVTKVLEGGPLDGKDSDSFDHPPIHSQEDWETFLEKTYAAADHFASLIAQLPDEILWKQFANEKYGNYYRNLQGIIEHTHYHLGQIAILKKIVRAQ
ncbi:DUF1572 domain-containing protein [Dokdonia ponticola]|uniref:DUF1572 domain-containing protein n=1 Tax=Dokdonia ponticola TaxID=2041041 RepID=A0ABV9HW84_9FLAO